MVVSGERNMNHMLTDNWGSRVETHSCPGGNSSIHPWFSAANWSRTWPSSGLKEGFTAFQRGCRPWCTQEAQVSQLDLKFCLPNPDQITYDYHKPSNTQSRPISMSSQSWSVPSLGGRESQRGSSMESVQGKVYKVMLRSETPVSAHPWASISGTSLSFSYILCYSFE